MSGKVVLEVVREARVVRLILNRPAAANALNRDLHAALIDALASMAADSEVDAVVLAAAGGRAFSAGADLKEMESAASGDPSDRAAAVQQGSDRLLCTLLAVLDFPKPLVCALHGKAVGAGAMLALAADEIHAAPAASLRFPEVTLAMPSPMSVAMLWGRASRPMIQRLVQQGDGIAADEALRAGLIDAVLPDAQLLDHAVAHAANLPTGRAYAGNKRWINLDLRQRLMEAANESKRLRQAQNLGRKHTHAT